MGDGPQENCRKENALVLDAETHTPEIAAAEAARLDALYRYKILDTPPEPEFDDFTRLAAHLCDTPIALLSLVDQNRQWFKSRVGLETPQTERKIAFCSHAIQSPHPDKPFVVSDAREDARFSQNPLVTAAPHLRFYAGAPLTTPDGHALGTLCVLDRTPRRLTTTQSHSLSALGRQVMHLMERRYLSEIQKHLLIERQLIKSALNIAQQQAMERESEVHIQFMQALEALSSALHAKDSYTNEHSGRVCRLAVALAEAVSPGDILLADQVDIAARFHDIGKIGVPEAVIQKPGRLNPDEFQLIQKHPAIGNRILLPLVKDRIVLSFVRHHHERWDGGGYPDGLKGEDIPLGARILAVADAFDAMTSTRPYRPALSESTALNILVEGAGQQWDAAIVHALVCHLAD